MPLSAYPPPPHKLRHTSTPPVTHKHPNCAHTHKKAVLLISDITKKRVRHEEVGLFARTDGGGGYPLRTGDGSRPREGDNSSQKLIRLVKEGEVS